MKRTFINRSWVALGIFLIALAAGVYSLVTREPSYQGKTVTEWLAELDDTKLPASGAPAEALRRIGPQALPFLMKELDAEDSPWKLKLVELAKKQSVIKVRFTPAGRRQHRAFSACCSLGPLAQPAAPKIFAMCCGGYERGGVFWHLYVNNAFGTNLIPELTSSLTNAQRSQEFKDFARDFLNQMDAKSRMAATN